MHIGLVGGIGPAATDYYYRRIIDAASRRDFGLDLTIVHADTPTLLRNLLGGDEAAQVTIFSRLAERLKAAGAEMVAITSVAGHFCIDEFKAVSSLPVIDMIEEVDRALRNMALRKVGILGARTVMETGLYGGIASTEIIPPGKSDLEDVHRAYIEMASTGVVTEEQREVFFSAGRRITADTGAEAVMLGGTDLILAFDGRDISFEVIDCASVHIDVIVKLAAK